MMTNKTEMTRKQERKLLLWMNTKMITDVVKETDTTWAKQQSS